MSRVFSFWLKAKIALSPDKRSLAAMNSCSISLVQSHGVLSFSSSLILTRDCDKSGFQQLIWVARPQKLFNSVMFLGRLKVLIASRREGSGFICKPSLVDSNLIPAKVIPSPTCIFVFEKITLLSLACDSTFLNLSSSCE